MKTFRESENVAENKTKCTQYKTEVKTQNK